MEGVPRQEAKIHKSVLVDQMLKYLCVREEGVYVDATVGDGGYSEAILSKTGGKSTVVGIDIDESAIKVATKRLARFGDSFVPVVGDYAQIEELVREEAGFDFVDGIVFDLGLRSELLAEPIRGFSMKLKGPLDMRYDMKSEKTAYKVINTYSLERLENVLRKFGDVKQARKIAKAIVQRRQHAPIEDTLSFSEVVKSAVPKTMWDEVIPKVFMAIRIEVNDELDKLKSALYGSLEVLKPGGRLVVVTYHSGEDRVVKKFFVTESKDCICPPGVPVCRCGHVKQLEIITKKPIRPSAEEIAANPRARSARLRAAEKVRREYA